MNYSKIERKPRSLITIKIQNLVISISILASLSTFFSAEGWLYINEDFVCEFIKKCPETSSPICEKQLIFIGEAKGNGIHIRKKPLLKSSNIIGKIYDGHRVNIVSRACKKESIKIQGKWKENYWYKANIKWKGEYIECWVFGALIREIKLVRA